MKLRFFVGPTDVGAETLGLVGHQARFSPLTSDFGQRLTGPQLLLRRDPALTVVFIR